MIYLVGSLRNPRVPEIASLLRASGYEVFDDWYAAGPEADDYWQKYEKERGHSYEEGLVGYAARHVYHYDLHHLNRADAGVLVLPAGKSGHLELGYLIGRKRPTFVLFDKEPERWDVMYQFATAVTFNPDELVRSLDAYIPSLKLPEPSSDADGTEYPTSDGARDYFELVGGTWSPVLRTKTKEWGEVRNPGPRGDSDLRLADNRH